MKTIIDYSLNYSYPNGKSIYCTMVLCLMDTEEYSNNYCQSLALVLKIFPEVDVCELEKELDKYI